MRRADEERRLSAPPCSFPLPLLRKSLLPVTSGARITGAAAGWSALQRHSCIPFRGSSLGCGVRLGKQLLICRMAVQMPVGIHLKRPAQFSPMLSCPPVCIAPSGRYRRASRSVIWVPRPETVRCWPGSFPVPPLRPIGKSIAYFSLFRRNSTERLRYSR